MGSRMKKLIFDEQTSKALKKWHNAVKKKKREEKLGKSSVRNLGGGSTVGLGSSKPSSGPTLHRFKTTGHSPRSSTFVDDKDGTDIDLEHESLAPMVTTTDLTVTGDHQSHEHEPHSAEETPEEGDFPFDMSETGEATPKQDRKLLRAAV